MTVRGKGWLSRPSEGRVSSWPGEPRIYGGHKGIDFAAAEGAPVTAAAAGRVERVYQNGELSGYGCAVVLAHPEPDGSTVYTLYAHLAEATVEAGRAVGRGELVGRTGGTAARKNEPGRRVAVHLHFEVLRQWPPPSRTGGRFDPAVALGLEKKAGARRAGTVNEKKAEEPAGQKG